MAMRRLSPILPPLMMMMSDTLNNQLEVARMRVVMFSALQGFLGLVAFGWSFIGQLLDATYYPWQYRIDLLQQTVIPTSSNDTTTVAAFNQSEMAFTVFYDTAATGSVMFFCCLIGLLFCSRMSQHGVKHDGSSDLGCLPLYIALSVAGVCGSFYLLHQNMIPYSVAHPWEVLIGSSKLTVHYAVRLAVGAVGTLINIAAIDAALRQLQLLSQVTFNARVIELYETFVRGGVIAATVETAHNSVSSMNAPDYAAATQFRGAGAAHHRIEHMSQQHHEDAHQHTRVINSNQQVVELTQQNINGTNEGGSVGGDLDGSESEEGDNVLALTTPMGSNAATASAPRHESPQAEYIATRKTHALHIATARGSVDNYESQSGAAAIINATRRSAQDSRVSFSG